jgi:hypothetical protein
MNEFWYASTSWRCQKNVFLDVEVNELSFQTLYPISVSSLPFFSKTKAFWSYNNFIIVLWKLKIAEKLIISHLSWIQYSTGNKTSSHFRAYTRYTNCPSVGLNSIYFDPKTGTLVNQLSVENLPWDSIRFLSCEKCLQFVHIFADLLIEKCLTKFSFRAVKCLTNCLQQTKRGRIWTKIFGLKKIADLFFYTLRYLTWQTS